MDEELALTESELAGLPFRALMRGVPLTPAEQQAVAAYHSRCEAARRAERLDARRSRVTRVRRAPDPERALTAQVRALLLTGPSPDCCDEWALRVDAAPTDRALLGAFADWLDEAAGGPTVKSHLLRAAAGYPLPGAAG